MTHRTEIRVRYPETDAMGIAHHTSHLIWFEIGRTEMMRSHGCSYAELEKERIFLPVVEVQCRYLRPVGYDDRVMIETGVADVGSASIRFSYRLVRPDTGELIATGSTLHAAVDGDRQLTRLPAKIRDRLKTFEPRDP